MCPAPLPLLPLLPLLTLLAVLRLLPLLPQITCPTLILHGRRDAVHPVSEARKLAAGIAGAELMTFDTANHLPVPGHPLWSDYVRAILDFLNRD